MNDIGMYLVIIILYTYTIDFYSHPCSFCALSIDFNIHCHLYDAITKSCITF